MILFSLQRCTLYQKMDVTAAAGFYLKFVTISMKLHERIYGTSREKMREFSRANNKLSGKNCRGWKNKLSTRESEEQEEQTEENEKNRRRVPFAKECALHKKMGSCSKSSETWSLAAGTLQGLHVKNESIFNQT